MAKITRRGDSYTTRISLTDPSTGQRIQPRITAKTKRDLVEREAQLRAQWANGGYVEPCEQSFVEYLNEWLGTTNVKPSTRGQWRRIIKHHVATDRIGAIKLGGLKHVHIQQFVDRRVASGLSPNHVRVMHAVVHRGLALCDSTSFLQILPPGVTCPANGKI